LQEESLAAAAGHCRFVNLLAKAYESCNQRSDCWRGVLPFNLYQKARKLESEPSQQSTMVMNPIDDKQLALELHRLLDQHPIMTGEGITDWLWEEHPDPRKVEMLLVQLVILFSHLVAAEDDLEHQDHDDLFMDLARLTMLKPDHFFAGLEPFFNFLHSYVLQLKLPMGPLVRQSHLTKTTSFCCWEILQLLYESDRNRRMAARLAFRAWIQSGFWEKLMAGLIHYKQSLDLPMVPLDLFVHTQGAPMPTEFLAKGYLMGNSDFNNGDRDIFVNDVIATLDAIAVFWWGFTIPPTAMRANMI